eukprot:PhF_6_TR17250/c0_g1_i1/m.26459
MDHFTQPSPSTRQMLRMQKLLNTATKKVNAAPAPTTATTIRYPTQSTTYGVGGATNGNGTHNMRLSALQQTELRMLQQRYYETQQQQQQQRHQYQAHPHSHHQEDDFNNNDEEEEEDNEVQQPPRTPTYVSLNLLDLTAKQNNNNNKPTSILATTMTTPNDLTNSPATPPSEEKKRQQDIRSMYIDAKIEYLRALRSNYKSTVPFAVQRITTPNSTLTVPSQITFPRPENVSGALLKYETQWAHLEALWDNVSRTAQSELHI